MRLRDVEPGDVGAYVRMRCDPVMMAELGGPQPREGMAAKVARDVQQAASDAAWIKMIIPDESVPGVVAGSIALWSHEDGQTSMSEIGWMVLPEFQGRGIATTTVRMLLALAREQDFWGLVDAFRKSLNAGTGVSVICGEAPSCSRDPACAELTMCPQPRALARPEWAGPPQPALGALNGGPESRGHRQQLPFWRGIAAGSGREVSPAPSVWL
jgi:hypothetical protein